MAEESLAKTAKAMLKHLKEKRQPREATWADIIDMILPGLETIFINNQAQRGKRIGKRRYDGTGVSALQLFADGLFGYLIAPTLKWLKLTMENEDLMEFPEVRRWLQAVEEHFYSIFNQTNFYDSMSTLFEYAPAMGFADLFIEEDVGSGKIVFDVPHPGTLYIAENKFGIVDTVYRELKIEAGTAIKKFGEDKVTTNLVETAKKNPYKEYDFIHATYPREDRDIINLTAQNKSFASVWIQSESDPGESDGKVSLVSGYDMNPHNVWRFKKGTTPYGMGAAEDALVEVLGANQIQKDLLRAGEMSVDPPVNAPAVMKGNVEITPGGINYFAKPDEVVSPTNTGIQFPIGVETQDRIRRAVEGHFKVEYFTLLSNINLSGSQAKTATEIIELAGEKAAVLSRPINRLNNETLNATIDRVWIIERDAGRLPPMPAILEDYIGEAVKINYKGPLAQAQEKSFQTQGINQGLEQMGLLMQIKPGSEDIIDGDETGRIILRTAGYPQKAIFDKETVKNQREVRAQVEQQEVAKEELGQAADVAKTFAEANKASDGALLEGIEGAV